jgi:superfamily II DNA or RNA helicase
MEKEDIQKAALEVLLPAFRAGVDIGTGVGKTLIGLKHADANYHDTLRVLVVAPKLSAFQSWKDDMVRFDLAHLTDHFNYTTYLSLGKQEIGYDIIYLDEAHSLLPGHEEYLDQHKGKIIGLTGTTPDKRSEKSTLIHKYCPIVYTYETDEAVEDHILNDYKIIVHKVQLGTAKDMKVEKGDKVWYTSEKASYDYWCNRLTNSKSAKETQIMRIMRMKELMGFRSKEVYAKGLMNTITDKCIVFCNTQDQADKMCPNSYHSKNPRSEENLLEFKNGTIMKLSCVLQLNEGVNIPNLKEGIIMHSYANNIKTPQRIGRLLRLNPDDTATIHILMYEKTVDETWVTDALKNFDPQKIEYK